MTFVVATRKLERLPQWVKVTNVFKSDSDATFLKQAGVNSFDDPNYERYSRRLARLPPSASTYRMDVLERGLSYDEVTEIFVRVYSRVPSCEAPIWHWRRSPLGGRTRLKFSRHFSGSART